MGESKENRHSVTSQKSVARHEISRARLFRQRLKPGEFLDYLIIDYVAFIMVGVVIIGLLSPSLIFPLSVLFLIAYLMSLTSGRYTNWALNPPIYLINRKECIKMSQSINKKNTKKEDAGLLFFGNDIERNGKSLWFNREELVTHIALFGTTGSGKTECLLGLMHQLMLLGSGFIFVDGKASIETFAKLYSMAKKLGLEDNFLVINFFTGGENNAKFKEKISNTFNPFAYGSSDTLMEILSGFMGKAVGENVMWRQRAEALGRCLLRALCELRDQGNLELSIDKIRENMPLEKLYAFLSNDALSKETKSSIQYYLNDLPGWSSYFNATEPAQKQKAELEVKKQHGYLTMQFTHVLELLASTYVHITQTDMSEVDFMDVVVNRRFLYVMLPALEKSPESLQQLGRLIVSSIKNTMSRLLGIGSLTGSKENLLDNKAFNADIPYAMIFDEYGSYCVEGFADVAAQSRSLNIMQIFAGQDFASFKQGSEIEAKRIASNTGIKIFMKTECLDTKQLAIERASSTYAYLSEDIKRKPESDSENYRDTGGGKLREINRIVFDDLFKQKPGQCHITYGDHLWRVKSFYGDFEFVENYRLNTFIKLKPASPESVEIHVPEDIEANESSDVLSEIGESHEQQNDNEI